jgi:hypothetical protein
MNTQARACIAIVVVLTVVVLAIVVLARRRPEKFASEGGPAGRALIGGSVVEHNMNSIGLEDSPCATQGCSIGVGAALGCAQVPCTALRTQEGFENQTWDERSNFTPNPHPVVPRRLGLDLMGVPRKFTDPLGIPI